MNRLTAPHSRKPATLAPRMANLAKKPPLAPLAAPNTRPHTPATPAGLLYMGPWRLGVIGRKPPPNHTNTVTTCSNTHTASGVTNPPANTWSRPPGITCQYVPPSG